MKLLTHGRCLKHIYEGRGGRPRKPDPSCTLADPDRSGWSAHRPLCLGLDTCFEPLTVSSPHSPSSSAFFP